MRVGVDMGQGGLESGYHGGLEGERENTGTLLLTHESLPLLLGSAPLPISHVSPSQTCRGVWLCIGLLLHVPLGIPGLPILQFQTQDT